MSNIDDLIKGKGVTESISDINKAIKKLEEKRRELIQKHLEEMVNKYAKESSLNKYELNIVYEHVFKPETFDLLSELNEREDEFVKMLKFAEKLISQVT